MILNPEQEKIINKMVESGHYGSPDEVIDAALRFLDERERKLEALQRDIQEGLDSGPGKPIDAHTVDEIVARGRQRLAHPKNPD